MDRQPTELQQRARQVLAHLAPYEEPVFIDYQATEDLYALRCWEALEDERVEPSIRRLLEDLQEYSEVTCDYDLDCWVYTFVRDALRHLAELPSVEAARAAVRSWDGFVACGWMASTRWRADSAGALSPAAGRTIVEALQAAQLEERLGVFDSVAACFEDDEFDDE